MVVEFEYVYLCVCFIPIIRNSYLKLKFYSESHLECVCLVRHIFGNSLDKERSIYRRLFTSHCSFPLTPQDEPVIRETPITFIPCLVIAMTI